MICVNTLCDTAPMESRAQRLKSARIAAGFPSARQAAMRYGWNPSTYAAHENGQNDFGAEAAQTYAKAFRTTAAWLLTGEGAPPRRMKQGDARGHDQGVESAVDGELGLASPEAILEVDARLGAGGGGVPVSLSVVARDGNTYAAEEVRGQWKLPDEVMREMLHASAKHIRIFEVIGDSMEPRLHEGDRVFIDLRYTAPSPEGIFALWDGMGIVIKRLQVVRNTEPPRIRVISVNEQYDPYEATTEEVRIIGRYAGRFTVR